MGHCGRTYVLPLFLIDSKFGSYEQNYNRNDGFTDVLKFVKKCYDIWWKQLRDKYTLEEFFMFGKENDLHLTPKYVNNFYV
jgi:hypothetical protein